VGLGRQIISFFHATSEIIRLETQFSALSAVHDIRNPFRIAK